MHSLLLVLHVLAWVFWLGTDIGVFLAAKHSQKQTLSVEARLAVLNVGMLLDRSPRFAVPVVWTTGMLMSTELGVVSLPVSLTLVLGLSWLIIVWLGIFQTQGTKTQKFAVGASNTAHLAVIVGMGGGALIGIANNAMPLWLAVKWLAFTLIGIAAIWLEKAFAPAVADYQTLAAKGSTPEVETALGNHLRPVYIAVLVIYAGTLIGGVSGLVKFN